MRNKYEWLLANQKLEIRVSALHVKLRTGWGEKTTGSAVPLQGATTTLVGF